MKYEITQTETKERLYLPNKKIQKVYTFNKYSEALTFAIFEQIPLIKCILTHVDDNGKKYKANTYRKPFKYFYSLTEFKKICFKNPIHYLGTRFPEKINIKQYYFYLFESKQLHKLRKA